MSERLAQIARGLVAPGKGILAADESQPSIEKKLKKIGVDGTIEENRRLWRQLLITSPQIEKYVSAVILFDETTKQKNSKNVLFTTFLTSKGIFTGLKVDKGLKGFGKYDEQINNDINGFEENSPEHSKLGLVFYKARSVYKISKNTPTDEVYRANAEFQAKYAEVSLSQGKVPIVEPEVLMDGSHSIETCQKVTRKALTSVFDELKSRGVDLSSIILKPNMVLAGKDSKEIVSDAEIARLTFEVLLETVPEEVPGIVFLSGGQSPDEATRRLRLTNQLFSNRAPWQLGSSFGRALQDEALQEWQGRPENVQAAQQAFIRRAAAVSLARLGR